MASPLGESCEGGDDDDDLITLGHKIKVNIWLLIENQQEAGKMQNNVVNTNHLSECLSPEWVLPRGEKK